MATHHHQGDVHQGQGAVVPDQGQILWHGHVSPARQLDRHGFPIVHHGLDGIVDGIGGVHHFLEIPIEFQSRLAFHDPLEVVGPRMLEGPFLEVATHALISGGGSHHGTQLLHKHLALGVGTNAVSTVGLVVIGMGDQRLFIA